MRAEVINVHSAEMEKSGTDTIVSTCIDFRKIRQMLALLKSAESLESGDFRLLATAGASMNDETFDRMNTAYQPVARAVDVPHFDCGFAKSVKHDDSQQAHDEAARELGQKLYNSNPSINYKSHTLPYIEKADDRHECEAVAIVLGKPGIVKRAFEEIAKKGLINNCDIIARPYELSPDDESIWGKPNDKESLADLPLSLKLHHPKKILIFDPNVENARMLEEKAKEIAPEAEVETIIISEAAYQESVA